MGTWKKINLPWCGDGNSCNGRGSTRGSHDEVILA